MTLKYQVEGEDDNKKYFSDRKMNLREDSIEYDYLVVFETFGTTRSKWATRPLELDPR